MNDSIPAEILSLLEAAGWTDATFRADRSPVAFYSPCGWYSVWIWWSPGKVTGWSLYGPSGGPPFRMGATSDSLVDEFLERFG